MSVVSRLFLMYSLWVSLALSACSSNANFQVAVRGFQAALNRVIFVSKSGGLNMRKMKEIAEFTESYEVPSSASFPASILSCSYATIAELIGNNKFSC